MARPVLQPSDLVAAALRTPGRVPWPADAEPARVVAAARAHGVAGLLLGAAPHWPDDVLAPLAAEARAAAMHDLRARHAVGALVAALEREGVASVLLKGMALAYSAYERPADRPRGDTDLLVAPGDVATARRVLAEQGFAHADADPDADGAALLQEPWAQGGAGGHEVDLHWQALNGRPLGPVLPVEECLSRARPLPRLHAAARALPADLALLHACCHRAMHRVNAYYVDGAEVVGADRLLWLADIHRLAASLGDDDWRRLVATARARGVGPVLAEGLRAAAAALGTPVPPDAAALLAHPGGSGPATHYLLARGGRGRSLADLAAAGGAGGAARLALRRLFPSRAFLERRDPDRAGAPLAWLWLRRVADHLRPRRRGPTP